MTYAQQTIVEEHEKGFVMIRRRIASAIGMAAVGMTVAVAVPSTAHADPYDCHADYYDGIRAGYAICYNGTGIYRVKISCYRPFRNYDRYGPWVGIGSQSIARCDSGNDAFNITWQVG